MKQKEINVEQVRMERYVQPSGAEIKLCLLEIPMGFVGYPYTVERKVNGQWQQRAFGMTYGRAVREFNHQRAFEIRTGSLRTLLGNAEIE